MPLYDYTCPNCGDFEAWRQMSEVGQPMVCVDCNATAARIYVAPNISLSSGSLSSRIGGSSEPRLIKRAESRPRAPKHQSQRGGRPWMLGHAPERL